VAHQRQQKSWSAHRWHLGSKARIFLNGFGGDKPHATKRPTTGVNCRNEDDAGMRLVSRRPTDGDGGASAVSRKADLALARGAPRGTLGPRWRRGPCTAITTRVPAAPLNEQSNEHHSTQLRPDVLSVRGVDRKSMWPHGVNSDASSMKERIRIQATTIRMASEPTS